MRNKNQNTSREANKQFFVGNCIENNNTAGDIISSDSINKSTESQTSTHNTTNMRVEHFFANASQVEAEEQFFGGNCGKGNATPNAEGTGSAEVINLKQIKHDNNK